MILGVVSDTHNHIDNVEHIIDIFNSKKVNHVIHTGDITQAKTLQRFSRLNCPLTVVYGNNDLKEVGLRKVSLENSFDLQKPPFITNLGGKNIAVLHEPTRIEEFINKNPLIDLILHGHTHQYRNEEIDGVRVFNPGECAGMFKGKNAIGLVRVKDLKAKRIFF